MAAYVALLADELEYLQLSSHSCIQRPPRRLLRILAKLSKIRFGLLEHKGILLGYRIKQPWGLEVPDGP